MKMYKNFDAWFWQLEGYHLLGERFFEEFETGILDDKRAVDWLIAAFEAGREQATVNQ